MSQKNSLSQDLIHFKAEIVRETSACILCAECFHNCPKRAIDYRYLEPARKRLKNGYIKLEKIQSAIYE